MYARDRVALPYNEFQEEVAGKVFAGWEYNKNDKVHPVLNTGNKPDINLKSIKAIAKDQKLNPKELEERREGIIAALKEYPNSLLFWAHAHIENIFCKLNNTKNTNNTNNTNNTDNTDMKYWKDHYDDWIEKQKNQDEYENDLMGETTSYTVAKINKLITINMITDVLDGTGNVSWKKMSEIFAKGAKGVVFFLTDAKTENDFNGTKWKTIERKELMRNKDVDMIIELDLINPEKVNSIIVKNGLQNAERYGFKLPNPNSVKKHKIFSENFKLKFQDNQIYCMKVHDNGAEIPETQKTLNDLANENQNNQQNKKQQQKSKGKSK